MIEMLSTYVEYGLRKVTENMEDETGQTLVEYGLILMFVSITALALTPLGQWVAARLTGLAIAI